MADLFGDFEGTPANASGEDPMAAFLAREQELLGDDAALFASASAAVPAVAVAAVPVPDASEDLFGSAPDSVPAAPVCCCSCL